MYERPNANRQVIDLFLECCKLSGCLDPVEVIPWIGAQLDLYAPGTIEKNWMAVRKYILTYHQCSPSDIALLKEITRAVQLHPADAATRKIPRAVDVERTIHALPDGTPKMLVRAMWTTGGRGGNFCRLARSQVTLRHGILRVEWHRTKIVPRDPIVAPLPSM